MTFKYFLWRGGDMKNVTLTCYLWHGDMAACLHVRRAFYHAW